jgi:hypothetical protein
MRIRSIIATGATLAAVAGSAIAFSGTANASTLTTCTDKVTHHVSATSNYVTHKWGCGKNYTETEVGTTQSATGAHSTFSWTKWETYPCWTKIETRDAWTAKGTYTHTVTHSSAC